LETEYICPNCKIIMGYEMLMLCTNCGYEFDPAFFWDVPIDDFEEDEDDNTEDQGVVISDDCTCPICMGVPDLDPIFQNKYEENGYVGRHISTINWIKCDIEKQQLPSKNRSEVIDNGVDDRIINFKLQQAKTGLKGVRNYLGFDIEIAKPIPENESDFSQYRPLGISCAGGYTSNGEKLLWYGKNADGSIAGQMSVHEVRSMVMDLKKAVDTGMTIVTWNGLGFDFDILAEESGLKDECVQLAVNHVDMMFHFFCLQGYPLGLDKAAKGMRLLGKTEGMSGALAPKYWAEGRYKEILEYVTNDARMTTQVAMATEKEKRIAWTSNSGRFQTVGLSKGWLSVREALKLPKPDNSWISDPWERRKFTGWTEQNTPNQTSMPVAKFETKLQASSNLAHKNNIMLQTNNEKAQPRKPEINRVETKEPAEKKKSHLRRFFEFVFFEEEE